MKVSRIGSRKQTVNVLAPPSHLPADEKRIWNELFGGVPVGQLGLRDRYLMLNHLKVALEERAAFTAMIESDRRPDRAQHWRSCVTLLHASARQLRLNPQQRLEPRRIGIMDRGRTRNDGTEFQLGGDHWRDLFPPAARSAKKLRNRAVQP